jgi:hypothetical protein
MSGEAFSADAPKGGDLTERILAAVERTGNKVPSPAILLSNVACVLGISLGAPSSAQTWPPTGWCWGSSSLGPGWPV